MAEILNAGKDPLYHLKRVGEVDNGATGAKLNRVKSAFEIAKEGGRHKGLYERNLSKRMPEVEKSIRSLEKQIAVHEEKIAAPFNFVEKGTSVEDVKRLTDSYWPKEIVRFKEEITVLKGVLEERNRNE